LREILHVGWPIAGGLAVEYWFFAATGLLVAQFGTASLAAHQIVVNFTSIFYMVVMAVANAANFRVAHAMGRGSLVEVRRSGGLAIAVGMGLGAVMVVVLWAFPRPIVGFYLDLDDPASLEVLPIAISLLAIAAIFQVGDAVQAVAAGALRGLRDTRAAMWAAVFGYWVIGVGCGLGLGYGAGLGAIGLWWGIAAGLSAAGAALALRFDRRTRALLRSAHPAEAMP
jgi:MATE family multidrug resistance protein